MVRLITFPFTTPLVRGLSSTQILRLVDVRAFSSLRRVRNCGGTLNLLGYTINNGMMAAYSGSTIAATGVLVNNGILDLLTSPQAVLPPGFVNNGIVIDSGNIAIRSLTFIDNNAAGSRMFYRVAVSP